MNNSNIICPVGKGWVNSNQVRLNAALICVSAIVALIFRNPFIVGLLGADFFIRGFIKKPFSIINGISTSVIEIFEIGYIKENKAPKQFAAKVGFIMSIFALIAYAFAFSKTFLFIIGVLIVFSFLEAVFSFCAGCIIYTLLLRLNILKP
jgi:ABC-type antimicrobial peptide transport system permease subunit